MTPFLHRILTRAPIPVAVATIQVLPILVELLSVVKVAARDRERHICYWFLIPLAARFVRIGFMVMGATYIYGVHGSEALINFYDDGFGPLARLPLWGQHSRFWSSRIS
jgi:hypothetical protein